MGLWYLKNSWFELIAYSDVDLAGCNDDYKSTFGGIQFLGDKLVSWSSKKQDYTSMSTAGAEFHTTGRCNNYAVLQSIPCSPECKIVGQILLDHPLSYALTTTADVHVVYLQQFWRTVSKTKIIILQMFHAVINRTNVDYAALLWIKEDYHSIKDDIPLVSVYTTGNVLVQEMLILDAFLTMEIRATDDFKEYETVFMNVDVPMNQPQPVVSTQRTHRSTPRAHRTPTLTSSPKGKKRKQSAREASSPRQSYKITIKRKNPSTTLISLPSDDRERDKITEATLSSLTLYKTALAAEAQENIAKL
nr:uncharacterized mitochondrial protein AtMg00810-like [Tanacetum cinerariifolium]